MDEARLDTLQAGYRKAVDEWVAAIRAEEELASVHHSVAELDKWETAHAAEHKAHKEVIFRKRLYEDALREDMFGFKRDSGPAESRAGGGLTSRRS